jgi:hypothetical protein
VDLFIMTPECTPALCRLDSLKEQLNFHYHHISQHTVSFAETRLELKSSVATLPRNVLEDEEHVLENSGVGPAQTTTRVPKDTLMNAPGLQSKGICVKQHHVMIAPTELTNVTTWTECIGYELICELLVSLIQEVRLLRQEATIAVQRRAASDSSFSALSMMPPSLKNKSRDFSSVPVDFENNDSNLGNFLTLDTEHNRITSSDISRSSNRGISTVVNYKHRPQRRQGLSAQRDMNWTNRTEGGTQIITEDVRVSDNLRDMGLLHHGGNFGKRTALPTSARSVLDQWLSSHWHDPYPSPAEKEEVGNATWKCLTQRLRASRLNSDKAHNCAPFVPAC